MTFTRKLNRQFIASKGDLCILRHIFLSVPKVLLGVQDFKGLGICILLWMSWAVEGWT